MHRAYETQIYFIIPWIPYTLPCKIHLLLMTLMMMM